MTPLDVAYLTAAGGSAPWLAHRLLKSSKGRVALREKLTGRVQVTPKVGPRVWFHGVSVGEIHLLRGLLPEFRKHRPDVDIVVSSTTETGLTEAGKLGFPVIAWPFDFSWAARSALRRVAPDLLVLAESELWPGLLLAAEHAGVPVVVVNGRMSPRSAARWRRIRPLARMIFGRVAAFAVQTPEYAAGLVDCGVPPERIHVTGSMKYDGVLSDRESSATRELRRHFNIQPGETVWVAGSTQAPEEAGCVRIFRGLVKRGVPIRLIIVPRQKERFNEVADLLRAEGVPFQRRSDPASAPAPVVLVDTIGELRAVWGLADIAFVGGSLDGARGGQNMIEPAAMGAAVTFGPHTWNFRATVEQLLAAGGAIQVADFAELERTALELLDPVRRSRLAVAAQRFVTSQQGATGRTLALIDQFLQVRSRPAA
ncbi:MAG: 3-deoxy-D-manno-octulosonic acid transferase [Gemmataceae bacterium]|nr:3-deoxy-D-manno-octulosonic acid transferase [Gemmataceae bacterium]